MGVMQDVRIRTVSSALTRRLKSVLVLRGQTLSEWYTIVAAKTADESKK